MLFEIDFTTVDGHEHGIEFRDAPVAFPILSTGRIADAGHTISYRDKGGTIVCNTTGTTDHFILAMGVGWLPMKIKKPIDARNISAADFGRRG